MNVLIDHAGDLTHDGVEVREECSQVQVDPLGSLGDSEVISSEVQLEILVRLIALLLTTLRDSESRHVEVLILGGASMSLASTILGGLLLLLAAWGCPGVVVGFPRGWLSVGSFLIAGVHRLEGLLLFLFVRSLLLIVAFTVLLLLLLLLSALAPSLGVGLPLTSFIVFIGLGLHLNLVAT